MEMEKKRSLKRAITFKKMETILMHEETVKQEKKFKPGEVEI